MISDNWHSLFGDDELPEWSEKSGIDKFDDEDIIDLDDDDLPDLIEDDP